MGRQGGTGHSVMAHSFAVVPEANIPRSRFDRSHGWKTTFNETDLVPIFIDEVLPGDTFTLSTTLFGRLATPIFPVMDNMYLDVFYFFCPSRLVWTHFVNFFGEQANPADTTSFLVPTVAVPIGSWSTAPINKLADYFGIPVGSALTAALLCNSLPFRAYNLIWNQWFRDENLQNSVTVEMDDGPDVAANYSVLPRGKRKDYFTGALPWPQKGPAVTIPLGTQAVVKTSGGTLFSGTQANMALLRADTGGAATLNAVIGVGASSGMHQGGLAGFTDISGVYPSNLYADLTTATAATINSLRQAFQIQKIYERDARGGTRYIELIKAHFGVTSPDARLQRTEYLGGGSTPMNINPIAQTSGTGLTGEATPQGNLAAIGTVHTHGVGFSKSFTEHGYVLGLVNFRADLNYQDGLDRMWSRQTRFDFYWPALAHIGEQAILNQELFATGTPATDTAVFGYQERYGEYRYKNSKITGVFRSTSPQPLDTWHLAQHFSALPTLNATFIQDAPPVARVIAVTNQPHILLDVYHRLHCARPMPTYGVPGLIDHF
jgi:hypothetical protein